MSELLRRQLRPGLKRARRLRVLVWQSFKRLWLRFQFLT